MSTVKVGSGKLSLPSYLGNVERVEARRRLADALEVKEMLISFGFVANVERHAGFWLIHWKFPKLRLVDGHVSNSRYR